VCPDLQNKHQSAVTSTTCSLAQCIQSGLLSMGVDATNANSGVGMRARFVAVTDFPLAGPLSTSWSSRSRWRNAWTLTVTSATHTTMKIKATLSIQQVRYAYKHNQASDSQPAQERTMILVVESTLPSVELESSADATGVVVVVVDDDALVLTLATVMVANACVVG
jgi:hypothetical protein